MRNKLLSLILVVALIASVVPSSHFVLAASAESSAVLTVEESWANPGSTASVNLVITENPGILGATLVVSWDESLTLVDDVSGEAFSHMTYTSPSRYVSSGTNFVWFGNEVDNEVDGTILTLTFQVSESADNNAILPISVAYVAGDVIDGNDNDVMLDITDGYVRVITYMPGDVTGDNRVNSRDLVRLSQYISDGCTTNPDGYNAEVIVDACDVNGDGRVNARDLIRLSQYISDGSQTNPNGYNAILNPAKMPVCEHPNITKTDYEAPSCTEAGNIAYWCCPDCAKYFSDANSVNEISYNDTVITEIGHTVVIDEAVAPDYDNTGLTEGSHCSVCDEIIVAQQTVSKLEATYHAIVYGNLQGAETPAIDRFAEHKGLLFEDVPAPVRAGYAFKGWYTASEGGTKVDMIAAGTNTDVTVFAQWSAIEYEINYVLEPNPLNPVGVKNNADNPSTYTVESKNITLSSPRWTGMLFTGWTDEDGNAITSIPQGSIGDITIYANWKSRINLVTLSDSSTPSVMEYDVETGCYFFIYDIATIEHVVLEQISSQYHEVNSNVIEFNLSQSTSIEESYAETLAKVFAESVTKSTEWSDSWADVESATKAWHWEAGVEIGTPETSKVAAKIHASGGQDFSNTNSHTTSGSTGGGTENGWSSTSSMSSEFTYGNTFNVTTSTTWSPEKEDPTGYYAYVRTGTVKTYVAIIYNPITQTFSVSSHNYLVSQSEEAIYTASASIYVPTSADGISFALPYEEIIEAIEDCYWVEFDPGEGEGTMDMSLFAVGSQSELPNCKFNRAGYTFDHWVYTDKNGILHTYQDAQSICDIAGQGEHIILTAKWTPIKYTVTYNANKPNEASNNVTGTMSNGAFTYDEAAVLAKNNYSLIGWTFQGWANSPSGVVIYADEAEVENLAKQNGETIELYAVWKPNTYLVVYDANGGTGGMANSTHIYDESSLLSTNAFQRDGYAFLGWSTNSNATNAIFEDAESVSTLTVNNSITLYAVWVKTSYSNAWNMEQKLGRDSSYSQTVSPELDIETLLNAGYTTVTLTLKVNHEETNAICFNMCRVQIYSSDGSTTFVNTTWDPKASEKTQTISVIINLSDLGTDGTIVIKYSTKDDGGSSSDGWYMRNPSVVMVVS